MSGVLVTGASGFLGLPLVRELAADGEEVHALSRHPADEELEGVRWHRLDMLDPDAVRRVVQEVRAERLVHLAWFVSHGQFWSATENVDWVQASLGLLRAFAAAGGQRALLVGSCAEYAWGGEGDLDEADSPLDPQSLYGVCKDALRRIAVAYASEAGTELAWARLFFLYGPREQPARLVPAVIRSLLAGERVATGTGEQVRDLMHVHDAAAALAAVLDSGLVGPVNVASGRATELGEVLDLIGSLTGAGELIERGAREPAGSDPARIVARVQRLEREVGFRPSLSLSEGLAATVDWWREVERAPTARP
ncbi:MAG TPA: NAD(P)-dependent oxidoreductase [Solirubrobacteraceae bacterium]|nr:NAD(P)-dependent oxidoreductase [Solirubrobacteraceae bacterium]